MFMNCMIFWLITTESSYRRIFWLITILVPVLMQVEALVEFDETELEELGITKAGWRKKLQRRAREELQYSPFSPRMGGSNVSVHATINPNSRMQLPLTEKIADAGEAAANDVAADNVQHNVAIPGPNSMQQLADPFCPLSPKQSAMNSADAILPTMDLAADHAVAESRDKKKISGLSLNCRAQELTGSPWHRPGEEEPRQEEQVADSSIGKHAGDMPVNGTEQRTTYSALPQISTAPFLLPTSPKMESASSLSTSACDSHSSFSPSAGVGLKKSTASANDC